MKKKGLCLVVICLLMLSGCEKTTAKSDYPAAIMVNDIIYYSTNERLSGDVDKNDIIGSITSYTDEMPTKNGEKNFIRDMDLEYAMTDEGLAVCIENEWILFEPRE